MRAASVTIGKNEKGAWCVYIDGEFVSDHRTRDGAATAANNHIEPYDFAAHCEGYQ